MSTKISSVKVTNCRDCPMFDVNDWDGYSCNHPSFPHLNNTKALWDTDFEPYLTTKVHYGCPLLLRDLEIRGPRFSMEKFASYLKENGWSKRVGVDSQTDRSCFIKNGVSIFLPAIHNTLTHSKVVEAIEILVKVSPGIDSGMVVEKILSGKIPIDSE